MKVEIHALNMWSERASHIRWHLDRDQKAMSVQATQGPDQVEERTNV